MENKMQNCTTATLLYISAESVCKQVLTELKHQRTIDKRTKKHPWDQLKI